MHRRLLHRAFVAICTAVFVLATAGCGVGGNTLPSTVVVELPDGTTTEVNLGDGAPSLANTTWDFFHAAGTVQGSLCVTVTFDENGALTRFENNTIASDIFGDTIYFDGQRHATNQQGLSYEAGTFGAETADGSAVAFDGRMTAFAAGFPVGFATASAQAAFDADDPTTMRGTFHVTTTSDLFPEANSDESFDFVAHKVE